MNRPDKTYVYAQTSMFSGALETHESPHGDAGPLWIVDEAVDTLFVTRNGTNFLLKFCVHLESHGLGTYTGQGFTTTGLSLGGFLWFVVFSRDGFKLKTLQALLVL